MPFKTATWFTYASRSERQTAIGALPRVSQNAVPISDRYVWGAGSPVTTKVSQPLHGSPRFPLVGAGWIQSQSSRVSEKAWLARAHAVHRYALLGSPLASIAPA
jgi:hypothetical protein